MQRLPLAAALAGLAAALLLAPSGLDAQQLQGRFLDDVDGQPLGGAYVVLLRGGEEVASTVTRLDGTFRLVAPAAGSYTLRGEQLGYGRVEQEVVVPPPGEALRVELRASQQAIELEGLVAEVDRQCQVPEPVARQVAMLWDEVAKAFQVTALLEERQLYDLRLETWQRRLDPETLRVLEEARNRSRGIQQGSPFSSLPPEELADGGYVRGTDREGFDYYAPDARVLLSPSFQDTHCFGVTPEPPSDGDEDWVGIRFAPRQEGQADIRGTLWIDGASLEPRRLDYRYTELPGRVASADLGGRVAFQRLPEGPWIVREWWIRMPRVQGVQYTTFNSSERRVRYEIAGILEVGGQVTHAGPRGGELVALGEPGRVTGLLRDASGETVAGGSVVLEGTIYRGRSDGEGRFRLDGVPPGRYLLAASSPLLDSLGLDGDGRTVAVEPGEETRVEVRLPAPAAVLAQACVEPVKADEAGVLRGVVRGPDGVAAAGAQVELSWSERIEAREVASRVAVTRTRASAALPVDSAGRWMACGLPTDQPLSVRALRPGPGGSSGGPSGRVVEVRLEEGEFPVLELEVPEATAERPSGAPAPDAPALERLQAELQNLGVRREVLGRRFVGPDDLSSRREGSAMGVVELVRVLNMPGIRVRQLRSGQTCIHSTRNRAASPSAPGGTPEPVCAAIVVDGVRTDIGTLESLPGGRVEALAYLRPSEAGARFGSGTDGGVLVVWTSRGMR